MESKSEEQMTFWEHVEVFRKVVFRCLAVWAVCTIGAFCFKDTLFAVLFAPSESDFVLYSRLCQIAERIGWPSLCPGDFQAQFINTELASQFMVHLQVAMIMGCIVAFPYLLIQLYGFVAPALYRQEKRYSMLLIFFGVVLFALGVLLNYFVIFPFAFRFLSTYQVQEAVVNQIALKSYISTLLVLSLLMGILFEIPIVAYFLAKLGIVDKPMMTQYRKHAFVVLCILAAVITPTADIFTLLLVTVPLYCLYEVSIWVVARTTNRKPSSNPLQ
ncbi:MAG: twin-arginine translocase subunit TatC [Paludibacteraceae bacterium]|nr:twin-arginine translocase subunit TatC [Bacteroidales bacterium]MDD7528415.1 twin-arginine translocase subunit TatC [Bacteroidales bacterium]